MTHLEDRKKTLVAANRVPKTSCISCTSESDRDAAFCGHCGIRLRPERASLTGHIVDELYYVEEKIAQGGFATIYRAVYLPSNLEVALKVLHADLAIDPNVVERFRREGKTLARLRDRHTITTYDAGETRDGTHYIVMELLHGESLHARLQRGPLPWRDALAIMRDACSSLAEAHAHGIVHRDLKPANIFFDDDTVKVLDFGLAKIRRNANEDLTVAGQAVGTLQYMPPEQIVGVDCDGRTDIYALGVVGFEMLTGQRPFHDARTAAALMTAVLTSHPRRASSRGHEIPHDVDALLARCLAREPEDRFADVGELAAAIDRALAAPREALARTPAFESQPPRIAVDDTPVPAFVARLCGHEPPPEPPPSHTSGFWRFTGLVAFLSAGIGLGTVVAQFV